MFWAHEVPERTSPDGLSTVTVFAGDYFLDEKTKQNSPPPDSWAANPDNDVAVLRIVVKPGGKMVLPKANKGEEGVNRTMYLLDGLDGIKIDGKIVKQKVCMTLDATKSVPLNLHHEAEVATEFLLFQGSPIDEPVVQHGPFVMNTQEEIRRAFYDYQKTRFGGWPWERDDMIFPQDKGRFALLNGKEFRPEDSIQPKAVEDEKKTEL